MRRKLLFAVGMDGGMDLFWTLNRLHLLTKLILPLELESTEMAVAVTALTARDRYVLHIALIFLSSAELKLGQNIHRNKVPERKG